MGLLSASRSVELTAVFGGLAWYPDGSGFVVSEFSTFLEYGDLYEYTFADNSLTPLTANAGEYAFHPSISPDGQHILYSHYLPGDDSATLRIRSLVGLDRKRAKERFAAFLDGQTYTADQIRFVNYIIDHLTANGTIDPALLYDQPYTAIHDQGLDGIFADREAEALLTVVREVNVVVEE